jgi:hypothetical protein
MMQQSRASHHDEDFFLEEMTMPAGGEITLPKSVAAVGRTREGKWRICELMRGRERRASIVVGKSMKYCVPVALSGGCDRGEHQSRSENEAPTCSPHSICR